MNVQRTLPNKTLALSLLCSVHGTNQLVSAQEKPRYYAAPYTVTEATFRQNVCDRQHDLLFGTRSSGDFWDDGEEIEIRSALRGMEIRPLITLTQYFNLTEDGSIDKENPGILAEILDELALRGGFTWRNSYGVAKGPTGNHTWTELLDWGTGQYDLSVDWWMEITERMALGITFIEGWYDGSIILIGLEDEQNTNNDDLDIWAWLKPFDSTVWIATLLTLIGSGMVFWGLEVMHPKYWQTKGEGRRGSIFLSMITFTGHLQHLPRTDASRVFTFSLALFSMLMMSTYTANLASFLVIRNTPAVEIKSLGDAVKGNMPICVITNSAANEILAKAYPTTKFHGHGTNAENFDAMHRGECAFFATSVSTFESYKNDRNVNGDCRLDWVGRVFQFVEAGFATKADSGILCTNLLRDVLNLHMVEMAGDGFIERAWKKHLEQMATIQCDGAMSSSDEDELVQLNMQNVGGLFATHAILTVVSLLWATCYLLHYRHQNRAATNGTNASNDDAALPDGDFSDDRRLSGVTQRLDETRRRSSTGGMAPSPVYSIPPHLSQHADRLNQHQLDFILRVQHDNLKKMEQRISEGMSAKMDELLAKFEQIENS